MARASSRGRRAAGRRLSSVTVRHGRVGAATTSASTARGAGRRVRAPAIPSVAVAGDAPPGIPHRRARDITRALPTGSSPPQVAGPRVHRRPSVSRPRRDLRESGVGARAGCVARDTYVEIHRAGEAGPGRLALFFHYRVSGGSPDLGLRRCSPRLRVSRRIARERFSGSLDFTSRRSSRPVPGARRARGALRGVARVSQQDNVVEIVVEQRPLELEHPFQGIVAGSVGLGGWRRGRPSDEAVPRSPRHIRGRALCSRNPTPSAAARSTSWWTHHP